MIKPAIVLKIMNLFSSDLMQFLCQILTILILTYRNVFYKKSKVGVVVNFFYKARTVKVIDPFRKNLCFSGLPLRVFPSMW